MSIPVIDAELVSKRLTEISRQRRHFRVSVAEKFINRYELRSFTSMTALIKFLQEIVSSELKSKHDRATAELFLVFFGVAGKTRFHTTWLPMLSVHTTDKDGNEAQKFLSEYIAVQPDRGLVKRIFDKHVELYSCETYDRMYVYVKMVLQKSEAGSYAAQYLQQLLERLYLVWNIRMYQDFIAADKRITDIKESDEINLLGFTIKPHHHGLFLAAIACAAFFADAWHVDPVTLATKIVSLSAVLALLIWSLVHWSAQDKGQIALREFMHKFGIEKFNLNNTRRVFRWVTTDNNVHSSFKFYLELRKTLTVRIVLEKFLRIFPGHSK